VLSGAARIDVNQPSASGILSIGSGADMKRFGDVPVSPGNLFLTVIVSVGLVMAGWSGLLRAMPRQVLLQAQNTTTVAPAHEFETASIKPNKSGIFSFRPGFTVDGYRASNQTVQWLIREAYGVDEYGLSGIPDWLNSERYDVEAKMDPSAADALSKLNPAQLKLARQQMLQALMAKRFNLKVHRETKDEPVYFLVVGKNGPKLRDAKTRNASTLLSADNTAARDKEQWQMVPGSEGGQKMHASSATMKSLGDWLTRQLSRPVLDKTGLTGTYDFSIEWIPDTAPTSSPDTVTLPGIPGASLFTALQQQLGLKLDPGKSPMEILVIDHVERPSGN
jgi:uncharacterized protein (TIGR03435 family)